MRLPVQWVNRPNADFRGYAGTLAAGEVHPGMPVVVLPSGRRSRVMFSTRRSACRSSS